VERDEGDSNAQFFLRFREHLNEVDDVSNVILKGHLEVEGHLDEVVDLIFFRPEYVRKFGSSSTISCKSLKRTAPIRTRKTRKSSRL
jgi:hypothetical protein